MSPEAAAEARGGRPFYNRLVWIVRELARLGLRVVVISAVVLVIGAGLALLGAGSFDANARVLGITLGCLLMAMGAVGRGSNIERFSDQGVMQAAWGTIPGFDALQSHPEEPHLSPGAALFLSGLVVVALGVTAF
jgi:hypothetical protein